MRMFFLTFMAVLCGACTTVAPINRPKGEAQEYVVACGSASGWNVCYSKANDLCPHGYRTIREDGGFNRKELQIRCE